MIIVRKSAERRHFGNKGQKNWMTFDSDSKADPLRNGFGVLKILNEEILSPGGGLVLHAHMDMVILTYVREGMVIYKGPLEEPDFMETKEFQGAAVASGVKQYAFNASQSEDAHIFQSGFALEECAPPEEGALKPKGMKKLFTHAERQGILKLIASSDGRESSLPIQQDVQIYSTFIHTGNHMIHEIKHGRNVWLHMVKGKALSGSLHLQSGDGVGLSEERSVSFTAEVPSEILLFDLCGQIPGELKTDLAGDRKTAEVQ